MPETSREKTVWDAIKTILTTDSDLSYLKNVFEGWRENNAQEGFPSVYMEPVSAPETFYAMPNRYKTDFEIKLIGEILVNDFDKQIFGQAASGDLPLIIGIMDLANDIKSVLAKYPNLDAGAGATCQKFNFTNTIYSFNQFPFRQVDITMKIELITTGYKR